MKPFHQTKRSYLRLFLLAGLLVALLGAAGGAPAHAATTSITIISGSGSGAIGTPDPVTTYSIPSVGSGSAYIMSPVSIYSTISGTRWVNTTGSGSFNGDQGSFQTATYTVLFILPAGFVSPSITVQVLADNQAIVSLNGTEIGSQPPPLNGSDLVNFQTISTFSWSVSSDFVVGVNTLSIANTDYGGPNGVNFKAVITYDAPPEPCSPGQYDNGAGCVAADPGFYVPTAGAMEQTPCAPGYYQPNSGAIACIEASPGHYVDIAGAAAQIACAPGYYQPNSGAESCIAAPAGTYVNVSGAVAAFPCDPGTYQPNTGSLLCLAAEPGNYVATAGSIAQTACAPGYYQPNNEATSCNLASPGHYVDVTAAVAQIACAPGYYQPNGGAVSCIAADPGYYVPESAATEQLLCPPGTTSTGAASSCTPAGYTFSGFFQPVDNLPALNVVKAGQAIPVKFSLDGDQGLDIMAAGFPASAAIACDSTTPIDAVEETVSAGSSSLSYDPATDLYTYVWKTNKAWANSCRMFTIRLDDGSDHQAAFKFTG